MTLLYLLRTLGIILSLGPAKICKIRQFHDLHDVTLLTFYKQFTLLTFTNYGT